nr:hypothetical protein KPSA3_100004 [Pseudomonas syringae pv. actinidiae]
MACSNTVIIGIEVCGCLKICRGDLIVPKMPEAHPTKEMPTGLLVNIKRAQLVLEEFQLSQGILVSPIVVQRADAVKLARSKCGF